MSEDRTTCRSGFDRFKLSAYLEGECTPDTARAVREHLAQCAECTAELNVLRAADSVLRAHPDAFHLDEEELIRFVATGEDPGGHVAAHLESCSSCREEQSLVREMLAVQHVSDRAPSRLPDATRVRLSKLYGTGDRSASSGAKEKATRVITGAASWLSSLWETPMLAFGTAVAILLVAVVIVPVMQEVGTMHPESGDILNEPVPEPNAGFSEPEIYERGLKEMTNEETEADSAADEELIAPTVSPQTQAPRQNEIRVSEEEPTVGKLSRAKSKPAPVPPPLLGAVPEPRRERRHDFAHSKPTPPQGSDWRAARPIGTEQEYAESHGRSVPGYNIAGDGTESLSPRDVPVQSKAPVEKTEVKPSSTVRLRKEAAGRSNDFRTPEKAKTTSARASESRSADSSVDKSAFQAQSGSDSADTAAGQRRAAVKRDAPAEKEKLAEAFEHEPAPAAPEALPDRIDSKQIPPEPRSLVTVEPSSEELPIAVRISASEPGIETWLKERLQRSPGEGIRFIIARDPVRGVRDELKQAHYKNQKGRIAGEAIAPGPTAVISVFEHADVYEIEVRLYEQTGTELAAVVRESGLAQEELPEAVESLLSRIAEYRGKPATLKEH